jgi:hypothetical protein
MGAVKPLIRYDESPAFGRNAIRADIQIGVLGLGGYGDTKASALAAMMRQARMYQAAINDAVEAIEAEIKEVGE